MINERILLDTPFNPTAIKDHTHYQDGDGDDEEETTEWQSPYEQP